MRRYASDISLAGNTGWTNPSGHVRVIDDPGSGSQYRSGAFHTFQDPTISHRLNFLRQKMAPTPWSSAVSVVTTSYVVC